MPLCADAQGLDLVVEKLAGAEGYAASVRYAVTLPQAEDDVVYDITLQQPVAGSYLIDWVTDTPSGRTDGFTAWFDGHFYNYRNRRLREYHTEWDSIPLSGPRAVQHTVQFASLVPAEIARELTAMAADTAHYSMAWTEAGEALEIKRFATDIVDAEIMWRFDPATGMPLEFSAEYNPGAISEQVVHATFAPAEPTAPASMSEQWLIDTYPDVFENYRQSNFAIESMPGNRLPAFSLPMVFADGGERLTRHADTAFPTQAALVVLADPETALTPRLVESVREAVARSPIDVTVLYAFTGRDPEVNRAALGGRLLEGENAVGGAKRLAADCGAAALPVVMACDGNATVKYVTIGLNNQLTADVIKMITLSTNSSPL